MMESICLLEYAEAATRQKQQPNICIKRITSEELHAKQWGKQGYFSSKSNANANDDKNCEISI